MFEFIDQFLRSLAGRYHILGIKSLCLVVGLGAGDTDVKMPIELPSQQGNHRQSKQTDCRQWHEDDKGGTCNEDRRVAAWQTVLGGARVSRAAGLRRPRASTAKAPKPEKAWQVKEQKEGRKESQAGDEKGGQRQAQVKALLGVTGRLDGC